jgi:hypothetical protein
MNVNLRDTSSLEAMADFHRALEKAENVPIMSIPASAIKVVVSGVEAISGIALAILTGILFTATFGKYDCLRNKTFTFIMHAQQGFKVLMVSIISLATLGFFRSAIKKNIQSELKRHNDSEEGSKHPHHQRTFHFNHPFQTGMEDILRGL